MKHLNDNLLTVVTIQTTGNNAKTDDTIQICLLILDSSLKPDKKYLPFMANMQPRRDGIDYKHISRAKLAKILQFVDDPYFILDRLIEWFEKYRVRETKKLMPLAYNWPFIKDFLIDWMGPSDFEHVFDYRYRDLLPLSISLNDKADRHFERCHFPKHHLSYLASSCAIDYLAKYDINRQALAISQIYRYMLSVFVG